MKILWLRSFDNNDQLISGNNLPINSFFFSVTGSTYGHRRLSTSSSNMTSDRFRNCITAPVLEHLHEVNLI